MSNLEKSEYGIDQVIDATQIASTILSEDLQNYADYEADLATVFSLFQAASNDIRQQSPDKTVRATSIEEMGSAVASLALTIVYEARDMMGGVATDLPVTREQQIKIMFDAALANISRDRRFDEMGDNGLEPILEKALAIYFLQVK